MAKKDYPVATAELGAAGFEVKEATDGDGNHLGYVVNVWTKGRDKAAALTVATTFSRALREGADWWAQQFEGPARPTE